MIGATALTNPHFSDLPKTLDHTLPKVIAHVAARYGDTPFIVGEDGTRISFAQFKEQVDDLARALIAHGVAYGDRVAIWAPNSAEWMIAAAAAESIGAIMVPINTRFKGGEALYILAKTRARILFTVTGFLGNDYAAMLTLSSNGAGSVLLAAVDDAGH